MSSPDCTGAIYAWFARKTIGLNLKCAFLPRTVLMQLHEAARSQSVPFCLHGLGFDIDDFLDQLDTSLTVSAFHDNFRVRLSGTVDLEFYNFEQPAPGLIDSSIDKLFNPRLTLFLDAQAGSQVLFLLTSAA